MLDSFESLLDHHEHDNHFFERRKKELLTQKIKEIKRVLVFDAENVKNGFLKWEKEETEMLGQKTVLFDNKTKTEEIRMEKGRVKERKEIRGKVTLGK